MKIIREITTVFTIVGSIIHTKLRYKVGHFICYAIKGRHQWKKSDDSMTMRCERCGEMRYRNGGMWSKKPPLNRY
jgi:hypothetical protein